MVIPTPQNAYLVANGTGTLYPTVVLGRDPTTFDLSGPSGQQFQVTQRWVNSVTDAEWFLLNFSTLSGYYQANWVKIAAGVATTETLTGNTGGPVPPTGNNINVIGDGTTITVAGNPGTSTLTISAVGGGVLEKLTGDSGSATPTAGNINIYGNTAPAATGLTFSGAASTLALGGTLNVSHGGTGATTLTGVLTGNGTSPVTASPVTQFTVLLGGASNSVTNVSGTGTAGQILVSNGAGVAPTWQNSGTKTFSSITVQTFTTTGTYTPTAGMLYCTVELVAGGGGGGGAADSTAGPNGAAGAGGGAGGYSRKTLSAASVGASQAVTIGAGGNGGAAGANTGVAGGNSSFGAIFSCTGGAGGTGGTAGSDSGSPGGAGGSGTGGDVNTFGDSGWAGLVAGSTLSIGGNGGTVYFGGSPDQIAAHAGSTSVTGRNATSYGAAGTGACTNNGVAAAGGNGFAGLCVVTEFV